MPDVTDSVASLLQANLRWLTNVSKPLVELLDGDVRRACKLEFRGEESDNDFDLFFNGELVLESCYQNLTTVLNEQLTRTDSVAMARPFRPQNSGSSKSCSILEQMVDVHYEVLLNHMPSLPTKDSDIFALGKPPYRNLVVFGSLMLVPLLNHLQSLQNIPWVSFTLIEDDPKQLLASLSLVDYSSLVSLCKQHCIGLKLHVDENKLALQDRVYRQVGQDDPTLLYGWQTLRSPVLSPDLMELHSWLHAPEGASQHVTGLLGFATDDINQTQQALWNALTQKQMRIIHPHSLDTQTPIVLVASGPSLMNQIDWLKENAHDLNIVAAGSAMGALLRAGIHPSAVVFLERSAETYTDLCDLLADGFSLEGISLLVSSTIDPRLPSLFSRVTYFHRPAAAATSLFPHDQSAVLPVCGPHVINAALEAVLALGSRKLLLVGTDFAAMNRNQPRADGALGVSPRNFSIPVQGNKGKTVFSEPGLLHTGYLVNRVLESVPDCDVVRVGQGIVLTSAPTVDVTNDLIAQFTASPNAFNEMFERLPLTSFCRNDCKDFLNLLEQELAVVINKLESAVASASSWSKAFAESFSPFLQRLHEGDSRQRRMVSQIICHPLFFAGMSLHDAPSTTFDQSKANFVKSLHLLHSVLRHWLMTMRPWLDAPQLPGWDPEWLRTRYRRMGE